MFKPEEIAKGYYADLRYGKDRKIYYNRDGKKKTFWIRTKKGDTSHFLKIRKTTKIKPDRKPRLRGPNDIILRKRYRKILGGNMVDFPFLSAVERRILTMKALGKKHAQIARALSGGRLRRSYTTAAIRGRLYRIYKKIRENDVEVIEDGKRLRFQVQRRT